MKGVGYGSRREDFPGAFLDKFFGSSPAVFQLRALVKSS